MTIQKRMYAFIVDYVLGSIFITLIPMIVTSIVTQEKVFTVAAFISMPVKWQIFCGMTAFVAAVYYFVIYPMNPRHLGQTLGKQAMKLRIVPIDQEKLTYSQMMRRELVGSLMIEGETAFPSAFFRYFLYRLIPGEGARILQVTAIAVSICSILWAVFHPSHRMIHDYVGGTKVCHCLKKNR